MEERLAELYGRLAGHMAGMIPVEWDEIYYLGEVEPERASWSSVFYFRETKGGGFVNSNDIPKRFQVPKGQYMSQWMRLNETLLEIYQCFEDGGQKPWEQLSFFVDRAGKFRGTFSYDVMNPQDGGQVARQLVWAHRTFGYLPEEGSWARKVLEERL